jgi:hypothetical protein
MVGILVGLVFLTEGGGVKVGNIVGRVCLIVGRGVGEPGLELGREARRGKGREGAFLLGCWLFSRNRVMAVAKHFLSFSGL